MDDATAMRLEKIRNTLQTAHVAAQVKTNRHAAVLAVALTLGAGFVLARSSGQVTDVTGAAGAFASLVLMLTQLRGLAVASRQLHRAMDDANAAIDKLMPKEGEPVVDAPPPDR